MEAAAEELQEGVHVTPNLKLVSRIGAGGMGSVWIAEHLSLETRVAVKFIAQTLATDAASAARFKREAAAAASVKSPHVVHVLDYGVTARGTPFIAMELLEGRDLRARIAAGVPMPARETVAIVRQVGRALSRAHEQGIVHRDIKPENVFLCRGDDDEPFVKVLDFGVAKRETEDGALTTTGTTVGTPYYMSPEQLVGSKAVDARSDLWSLGVMTFFMLTGKRPFTGETAAAVAVSIHNGPLPMPTQSNPRLPPSIDAWFAKACARDPSGRFASAKELATALARALETTPSAAFGAAATSAFRDADALDRTVPVSAQSFPSSEPTRRDVPSRAQEAPSSSALSASAGAAVATSTPNRSTRVAWGIAVLALVAVGVMALRAMTAADSRRPAAASTTPSAGPAETTSAKTTEDSPPTASSTTTSATSTSTPSATTSAPTKSKPPTSHTAAPLHVSATTATTAKTTATTAPPPPTDDLPTLK